MVQTVQIKIIPNLIKGKLARHDQLHKHRSKENKPIEFRRCLPCSSIFFQSVLMFFSISMYKLISSSRVA